MNEEPLGSIYGPLAPPINADAVYPPYDPTMHSRYAYSEIDALGAALQSVLASYIRAVVEQEIKKAMEARHV